MKKIFINIQAKIDNFDNNYAIAFLDIKKKYNVEIYNFFIKGNISNKKIQELINSGINFEEYINEEDLLKKVGKLKKENITYFINTYTEKLIPATNKIKKIFGQKISSFPELFRNKRLQRELLLKSNKGVGTNFKKINIKNINFLDIKNEFGLPFVIKPSNGVQSAGVSVIKGEDDLIKYVNDFENLLIKMSEQFNLDGLEMIIEEYIDGDKHAIDYYVDEYGEITGMSEPTSIISGEDIGINDLFEFALISSTKLIEKINIEKLKFFLKESIKISEIRNSYLHHEFKLTSKNEFKTIEINGRIGGIRTEIYRESSNLNLLSFMFEKKGYIESNTNFTNIFFYSEKEGILKEFNKSALEQIYNLESFVGIDLIETHIGKKVGLTNKGYGRCAQLRLKNKNIDILLKDIKIIEENFNKLLILK